MARGEHLPAASGSEYYDAEIESERHIARTLLVQGKLNGLEFNARMRDVDALVEAKAKRRFAIYMRMLEQEKNRTHKQSEETFADRQRAQAAELLAQLQARLKAVA